MIDLIGLISILIISLIYMIVGLRNPAIFNIIFVGLLLRILTIFFGYLIPLPDSGADSRAFEIVAWSMAQDGLLIFLNITQVWIASFIVLYWLFLILCLVEVY